MTIAKLVFLGGIFPNSQIDFIHKESKGVVQSAADALQKSFIKGFSSHHRGLEIVNLPYVGSYPRLFNKSSFPATAETFEGVPLIGQWFTLRRFAKTINRLTGAFKGLWNVRSEKESRPVVIVYAAHLPFLLAALANKALGRVSAVCLILPDLPQFMAEGGRLYRMAKAIETVIFNRLTKHIDYFAVLTEAMAEKLNLPENRYVVVEGIANEIAIPNVAKSDKRVFMYAGTLSRRYGIVQLLEAFKRAGAPNAELWICGEGDSRNKVEAAAKSDSRIKFLGQLPRNEVLRLQLQATVLVNPRSPEGEFTKYSFPSKTMEYMAAARPVLMYRLPGMPTEYHDYIVSPEDTSVEAFALAIEDMAGWDDKRLSDLGRAGREFVLTRKNPTVQAGKILAMIERGDRTRKAGRLPVGVTSVSLD